MTCCVCGDGRHPSPILVYDTSGAVTFMVCHRCEAAVRTNAEVAEPGVCAFCLQHRSDPGRARGVDFEITPDRASAHICDACRHGLFGGPTLALADGTDDDREVTADD